MLWNKKINKNVYSYLYISHSVTHIPFVISRKIKVSLADILLPKTQKRFGGLWCFARWSINSASSLESLLVQYKFSSRTFVLQACHENAKDVSLIVKCKCAFLKEQEQESFKGEFTPNSSFSLPNSRSMIVMNKYYANKKKKKKIISSCMHSLGCRPISNRPAEARAVLQTAFWFSPNCLYIFIFI